MVGAENLLKCDVQGNRRAPDVCLVSLFSLVKIYNRHHVSYQGVVTDSLLVCYRLSVFCAGKFLGSVMAIKISRENS